MGVRKYVESLVSQVLQLSSSFFQLPYTATVESLNSVTKLPPNMVANPSTAPTIPEEDGFAIPAKATCNPDPSKKARNNLQVTQVELEWAHLSSRDRETGWIIVQIEPQPDQTQND